MMRIFLSAGRSRGDNRADDQLKDLREAFFLRMISSSEAGKGAVLTTSLLPHHRASQPAMSPADPGHDFFASTRMAAPSDSVTPGLLIACRAIQRGNRCRFCRP